MVLFSFQIRLWRGPVHTARLLVKQFFLFKISESVFVPQLALRAHFILCQNNAVLDRIFNPLQYRFFIKRISSYLEKINKILAR